jgi:hypothetical protein
VKKIGQKQRKTLLCPKSGCYEFGVNNNSNRPTMGILPQQETFRRELPKVSGNVDYTLFESELKLMDEVILKSGIETLFVKLSLERYVAQGRADGEEVGGKALERQQRQSRSALRCTVLRHMLGESYRDLSMRLAQSELLQWFCGIDNFGEVRVPSKSALQEYAQRLDEETMTAVLDCLKAAAARTNADGSCPVGLDHALELDVVWMDSTALKAPIHFPVDWVLLRDGARTLLKAIELIRQHGLKHRMEEPGRFLSQMNKLCMAMSAARRQSESKKQRKKVLRMMKRLLKVVEGHARRYHQLLDEQWPQTDWTRVQAEAVLRRIQGVLDQLPQAIQQAHERIIGERKVANKDKILSLYESDIHVIVRGKAGAEVEFGNSLFLAEQSDGFIVDHELSRDAAPGDAKWLARRIDKLAPQGDLAKLSGVFSDRGFASKHNSAILEAHAIFDGLCPRDPKELATKMKDEVFAGGQKRRAQTEARVAILKNVFLDGGHPRSKGFAHRQTAVQWAVLTHNLRVLARMRRREEEARDAEKSLAA